jgi:hypothetical protein
VAGVDGSCLGGAEAGTGMRGTNAVVIESMQIAQ